MKATEGRFGRVFLLRLEDGDIIPDCIEEYAKERKVAIAQVMLLGGADKGDVVVGPRETEASQPDPMLVPLEGAHEIVGLGVIAPDEDNNPVLHMHAAHGREGNTITGCVRPGIKTWLVGEVVICEILFADARRIRDEETGFSLLNIL